MCGCSFDVMYFKIHGDLGRGRCQLWCPKRVIWHACSAHFGPKCVIWHAVRSRATSAQQKTLGSRLGLLLISVRFRHRILKVFGNLWNNKCVFCYACLHVRLFNDFGVCFWMSGKQAFGERGVAKNNFLQMLEFC